MYRRVLHKVIHLFVHLQVQSLGGLKLLGLCLILLTEFPGGPYMQPTRATPPVSVPSNIPCCSVAYTTTVGPSQKVVHSEVKGLFNKFKQFFSIQFSEFFFLPDMKLWNLSPLLLMLRCIFIPFNLMKFLGRKGFVCFGL